MATKIKPGLKKELAEKSAEMFNLIVRAGGEITSHHLEWLAENGIEVKQQFRLTPGLAVSCRGQAGLKLLEPDWIASVEKDAAIKAM